MATVEVARLADEELRELVKTRSLPADTADRIEHSLATLEQFPRAGRALSGVWRGYRALVGPWGWLIAVYIYEDAKDTVTIVAFHDARSASSTTAS